jgi:hypothetical protein
MSEAVTTAPIPPIPHTLLASLRASDAPDFDAVGWHYIEVLSQRAQAQTGAAHALLNDKLCNALRDFQARLEARQNPALNLPNSSQPCAAATPSPLANLLRDMAKQAPAEPASHTHKPPGWRAESPGVKQFRKQLGKISVQKQVTQAIAQAPQNAGPINSHMLVLRSLGLMRQASPDYLNRFMTYVDTLLSLEAAGSGKPAASKLASVTQRKKKPPTPPAKA